MRLAINFQRVDPSKGGAETYVADLCRRLVQAGHRVDLFAESWAPDALPDAVRCETIEARGRTRRARLWDFARNSALALKDSDHDCTIGLINTWEHDVLIPQGGVHGASLEHNARRFATGWRRNLYLLAKRTNPKFALYREVERRQYDPSRRARVIAVSEMVRGHLQRFHGVPADRIQVVPNAIDAGRLAVADPAGTRSAFRESRGIAADALVALFVGHNFDLKGLPVLLAALASRDHRKRPIHLLVCGGGRLGPARRRVERLGLQKTVHLIGYANDVRPCFWASDLFVLPTYYDPCSLVVFEALACGLPVVTSSCNGAGELITQGREGFVVGEPSAPDAPIELAARLDALTDDDARRAMSENAVRLGQAQSLDNHVAKLIAVFQDVAESKRKARSSPRRPGRIHEQDRAREGAAL